MGARRHTQYSTNRTPIPPTQVVVPTRLLESFPTQFSESINDLSPHADSRIVHALFVKARDGLWVRGNGIATTTGSSRQLSGAPEPAQARTTGCRGCE